MRCKFCDKEHKNGNSCRNHERFCKDNPDRKDSPFQNLEIQRSKVKSNQYLKAEATGGKFVVSPETKSKLGAAHRGKIWSDERKEKFSAAMKEAVLRNPASYTSSNRGRTKQFEKYGLKFQGKWELLYYEWCLKNSVKIERCDKRFPYQWNGLRSYNPDFYLPETDTYVEVKGYETERDRAKWRDFPHTLRIIRAKEIKQMKS